MALKSAEQCIIAQLVRVGMPKAVIRAILDIDMRTLQGYIEDNNLQVADETIAISRGKTPQAIHRAAKMFVEHRNLYELMEVLYALPQEARALLYREIAQILESEGTGMPARAGTKGHGA